MSEATDTTTLDAPGRLLGAAYTSYRDNCGTIENSARCAEADLLGKALEALRAIKACPTSMTCMHATGHADAINAVLASVEGGAE